MQFEFFYRGRCHLLRYNHCLLLICSLLCFLSISGFQTLPDPASVHLLRDVDVVAVLADRDLHDVAVGHRHFDAGAGVPEALLLLLMFQHLLLEE